MTQSIDVGMKEAEIINNMINLEGCSILDIGCGEGRITFQLANVAEAIIGIDISEKNINEAKKKNKNKSKIKFIVTPAENLTFSDGQFDVVIFSQSLCCIQDQNQINKALNEAWRVLKQGGKLVNIQASMQMAFNEGTIQYLIKNNMELYTQRDNVIQSRFALKYQTFIEKKWTYQSEMDFTTLWSFDTLDEICEYYRQKYDPDATMTPSEWEKIITHIQEHYSCRKPVIYEVNETITLLIKS